MSGRGGNDKTEQSMPTATVYSFFHRELAPMAKDVVQLLRSCNSWVDPNLLALAPESTGQGEGETKRKRRKRTKNKCVNAVDDNTPTPKKSKTESLNEGEVESMDDEFPNLAANRIVLRRARHVPPTDSDDDNSS